MSPELKELIEEHRYYNVEHQDWWEHIYADFSMHLERRGITVEEIQFSGFASQGDGASFTGYVARHDMCLFMEVEGLIKEFPESYTLAGYDMLAATIGHRGRYYHHMSATVEINDDVYNEYDPGSIREAAFQAIITRFHESFMAFEARVTKILRNHMQDLYKSLNDEHDYLTSDEGVLNTLVCNDMIPDEIVVPAHTNTPNNQAQTETI
jgi:hypothetical protein